MALDSAKFAELQYQTLRKEIETSKANMQKYIIGGGAVVPGAQYLAEKYDIGALTLALPVIVVVLVLLFLAENHAMMRAGTYILKNIETQFQGFVGWETWLNASEGDDGSRTVDKLVVVAFAIVAASYFMASVVLAGRYALEEFGANGRLVFVVGYLSVGIGLAVVLYVQAKTDTSAGGK